MICGYAYHISAAPSIFFLEENHMENLPSLLQCLIVHFSAVIETTPSAQSFATIVLGWILANGQRTMSGVVRAAGPHATKSHDAYHNFFSKSSWSIDALWRMLFVMLVRVFVINRNPGRQSLPPTIWIAGDDTLSKHWGRKIWGAGLYRDAVRSSKKHTAYAWGLNWVVLAMIVRVPLLKERFIALPILARLNPKLDEEQNSCAQDKARKTKPKGEGSKKKKTTVTIMEEMIRTVAAWFPEAQFLFCGDGAYACVAGRVAGNVEVVSRIRRDAALYAPPPKRRKKGPGRPAKRGRRLPTPQKMADQVGKRWKLSEVDLYGKIVERQLYAFNALWYEVCPDRLVRIVIVRDPAGKSDDEFFFTTDLDMAPEAIVHCYTGRWAIEVVFRETKQYLGMDQPQARKKKAVLRITPLCLWLNSVIKLWFVLESEQGRPTLPQTDPWYHHKDTISFQDMLGAVRLYFWRHCIFHGSTSRGKQEIIQHFVAESLAKVA